MTRATGLGERLCENVRSGCLLVGGFGSPWRFRIEIIGTEAARSN